jgi:hypothetical protein
MRGRPIFNAQLFRRINHSVHSDATFLFQIQGMVTSLQYK